jgi:hypothetical protein
MESHYNEQVDLYMESHYREQSDRESHYLQERRSTIKRER